MANASVAQLQVFGRQVAANAVEGFPAPFGPRFIDHVGSIAASKLRAQGYSAVQANVAALAASAYVRSLNA